ncbi:hypothetical protein EC12741_B0218 [Escherichia coli 1.2741]|nr:hypothetical protein EC12741_B0218 [Escherichia coli 1.2741]
MIATVHEAATYPFSLSLINAKKKTGWEAILSGWKARYSRRDRSFVARDSLQVSLNSHIVQESVARFCHTLRKRYTKSVFMSKATNG